MNFGPCAFCYVNDAVTLLKDNTAVCRSCEIQADNKNVVDVVFGKKKENNG